MSKRRIDCIMCSAERMGSMLGPVHPEVAGAGNAWATLAGVMRHGVDPLLRAFCERHMKMAKDAAAAAGLRWPDDEVESKPS